MQAGNRHLEFRAGHWHYNRRVPARYAAYDDRGRIRVSLKTTSLDTARERRDALKEADDLFWASLCGLDGDQPNERGEKALQSVAQRRYQAAGKRAMARGFTYAPAEDLASSAAFEEIIARIKLVDAQDNGKTSQRESHEAESLLGGVEHPKVKISEALDVYLEQIAAGELSGKSREQRRGWTNVKKRAVKNLTKLIGDKPIFEITRQDALKFHQWWLSRMEAGNACANTANRDMGNVRKLFTEYSKFIGEEERQNPFRNLLFQDKIKAEVLPFENDWVRTQILAPGAFKGLNEQAALIVYVLIETGCRPSEIGNLEEEDIVLGHAVPHIRIRPKEHRQIKTRSSIREIPLVGVSLEAMKKAPTGFDRYRDKNNLLSASLMKAFKSRGLLPSAKHRIYSFRHSFEKRMLEAGIDRDLRMTLMGHSNARPEYGDGGSLEFRRNQLLKIAIHLEIRSSKFLGQCNQHHFPLGFLLGLSPCRSWRLHEK